MTTNHLALWKADATRVIALSHQWGGTNWQDAKGIETVLTNHLVLDRLETASLSTISTHSLEVPAGLSLINVDEICFEAGYGIIYVLENNDTVCLEIGMSENGFSHDS